MAKITQRTRTTAIAASRARLAPDAEKTRKAPRDGGDNRFPVASTYRLNKTNVKRKPAARRATPREKLQRRVRA